MISFSADPAPAIAGLAGIAGAVEGAVEVGVAAAAEEAAGAIRSASEAGRPGPIGRSHTNRDSIEAHPPVAVGPGVWDAEAGPTSAYGRRLELGFTGTDSSGRHYNQPPYPFVEPGTAAAESAIELAIVNAVNAALGGA